MSYGESSDHLLDDVTCLVFLFGTDYILSLHFQNRQNYLEIEKNSKYNRKKTSVYHTVNCYLHCFTHRKQQKW